MSCCTIFRAGGRCSAVDLKELHAKIRQLPLENDFLFGALSKAGLLRVGFETHEGLAMRRTSSMTEAA